MIDLGTNTIKSHVHLSDLIKLPSSGVYEPVTMRKPVLGDGGVALVPGEEEGSGASTPPLWRPERPESRGRNYAALSPKSRTEAISKGQMELMEMVKNMPEASYELSLKDLVEVNRGIGQDRLPDQGQVRDGNYARRGGGRAQWQHRHNGGQMVRSRSLDGNSGAFLLKMVFPVPWRTRKKKKKIEGLDANTGNTATSNVMVPEKEWWRTRVWRSTSARGESAESSGGESGGLTNGSRKSSNGSSSRSSSTSSSSNNNSSRRYELDIDCWSFIRTNKGRSLK